MPLPARRRCEVDLPLDLAAPRAARHLLELLLPQWGVGDPTVVDGAALVLSELVTHALGSAGDAGDADDVTIGAELREDALRLWVLDRSPAVPAQRGAQARATDARGLVIVGRLATRWGVEPHGEGLRSYADVPLASVSC